MTDYIKVPTQPTQDLLRGIEAISPALRINSQQPRRGYPGQSAGSKQEQESHDPRRFLRLRQLIRELQGRAQINKVDLASADSELHSLGLAIVEETLIPELLRLKIPLESIEQLLEQLDRGSAPVRLSPGRRIKRSDSLLFPVSTEGLSEYNLNIEELKIKPGKSGGNIVDEIRQAGLCIKHQKRLRLLFRQLGAPAEVGTEALQLRISVLLGVIESDDAERRAILYPQAGKNYGLYADKLIDLSI